MYMVRDFLFSLTDWYQPRPDTSQDQPGPVFLSANKAQPSLLVGSEDLVTNGTAWYHVNEKSSLPKYEEAFLTKKFTDLEVITHVSSSKEEFEDIVSGVMLAVAGKEFAEHDSNHAIFLKSFDELNNALAQEGGNASKDVALTAGKLFNTVGEWRMSATRLSTKVVKVEKRNKELKKENLDLEKKIADLEANRDNDNSQYIIETHIVSFMTLIGYSVGIIWPFTDGSSQINEKLKSGVYLAQCIVYTISISLWFVIKFSPIYVSAFVKQLHLCICCNWVKDWMVNPIFGACFGVVSAICGVTIKSNIGGYGTTLFVISCFLYGILFILSINSCLFPWCYKKGYCGCQCCQGSAAAKRKENVAHLQKWQAQGKQNAEQSESSMTDRADLEMELDIFKQKQKEIVVLAQELQDKVITMGMNDM